MASFRVESVFGAGVLAVLLFGNIQVAQAGWWERHAHPIGRGISNTASSIAKNPGEALPPCWGSPQTCRGNGGNNGPTVVTPPQEVFLAAYRVDCYDYSSGRDSGDQTLTVTSPVSIEVARDEIVRQLLSSDICRSTGDLTRMTRPGSGRWL